MDTNKNRMRTVVTTLMLASAITAMAGTSPSSARAMSCDDACERKPPTLYTDCVARCENQYGEYLHGEFDRRWGRVREEVGNRASNLNHQIQNIYSGWKNHDR